MNDNQQLPVRLKPNRRKLAFSLILALVLSIASGWVMSVYAVTGICMGIFFTLSAAIFALQFLPNSAYLELHEDGFTVCHLFRPKQYRWETIEVFSPTKFSGSSIVEWTYKEEFAGEVKRDLSSKLIGTEASLPDTYGMSAEELTELMNGLLQKHQ